MECLVCQTPEAETARDVDRARFDCADCGAFEVTGTVMRILDRGQWLRTTAMQQWIREQHDLGVKVPVIHSEIAEYEGITGPLA
ncbi:MULTISPECIES: hypothetical protein [unclassified Pseudomonas]|uniref:hypothetical protein n=1 Tax=unclassified Pseudomonas TaxID=196821 RepID=UPI0021671E3E|nr:MULTISPECIES: hypothetical protein [unclassified Pseudomonas]MCS4250643.1 hypothetical protein [Pseudomonas sp. BIGb0164]WAT26320.1 hypothetical protein OZ428_20300 [Pseudomonas sp. GXZC]